MQVLRDLDAFVPVSLCGQGEQSPSRHYLPGLSLPIEAAQA